MAAETFVFNIAGKLLGELVSPAFQEACLVWGVESDLRRLENTLSNVKAVLLDAEEQQFHNQELTVWLGQLKEVFYDAQDVLGEFEYEALQRQVVEMQGSTGKVRRFFSSSNTLVFRTKMAHKVKEIRARLDEVAADRAKFHLSPRSGDRHVVRGRGMTYSFVRPSDVIGRDQDKENIVEHLMDPSDGQSISVVPVVGIGGLGKTALAKLVFNDERVIEHFELKCWVCVSDEFVLKQLLVKIIKSITSENRSDLDEEQLQVLLRNNLDGKKFFLVLDDVWNEDRGKWVELKNLLMGGANGSKILVTTRSPTIASMMGTMSPYNLEGLLHQDCLPLFMKWAFDEGKERQHRNLVEIGDAIVKKCKGVPLAVKSLGSLLYSEIDERDWLFVRDNEMWKLNRKEGDILSVLQLSYNQMPSYLKQCFAFLSLFPKDFEFNTYEVIPYWMANGLLQSPNENQEPEDIGNQYIDELYSRCFLEDYIDIGYVREFKIHDLAHDLALSSAQSECLIINCQIQNISKKVWHFSYSDNTWQNENVLKCLQKSKSLRTILSKEEGAGLSTKSLVDSCLSKFRYLRILDLSDSSFEVLPSSVGTMKHLRLLDLTNNCRIHKLPNSICKLHNLQTLFLSGCEKLEELPKDIRYLIRLRIFLVTTKQKSLPRCPNSLRFLGLSNFGNLESLVETMQVCTSLRSLRVDNCGGLISLLPALKFLTTLEALFIENCEKLDLTEMEDNQDDFPTSLRVLVFIGLPQLVAMPDWVKCSARSLQILLIRSCPNLTAWPKWLVDLEMLRKLSIVNCPKLSSLPKGKLCLPALESFSIAKCPELIRRCQPEIGEDWHKITHVSEIYLDYKQIK